MEPRHTSNQGGRKIVLTAELIQTLKLPTAEVRRKTGLAEVTIRMLKKELGLPVPPNPAEKWTPEVIARLGTVPDSVIAEELGIRHGAVGKMRRRLGISACLKRSPWTPEEDALLGTDTDERIARRLGRPTQSVRSRRHYLKIPVVRVRMSWTPEKDALLRHRLRLRDRPAPRLLDRGGESSPLQSGCPAPAAVRDWLSGPQDMRDVGLIFDGEKNMSFTIIPRKSFDVLLFVEKIGPLRVLPP